MLVYHPARKSVAELESKWSRHIAHELEKSRGGKAHVLKWTARSIAVVLSIFPHLGTIALSEKLTGRSEEHTSELQSLMRISYAVFCLKKKNTTPENTSHKTT